MPTGRFVVSGAAAALVAFLLAPLPSRAQTAAAVAPHVPTVDELVELGSVAAPTVSPDGRWIAYEETLTDWEKDAFVAQVFVADTKTGTVAQLTRGRQIGDLEWSPDSRWITFLRSVDDKAQIHAIRPDGGEAIVLTRHDAGITNHEWSPDGRTIVFAAPEGEPAADKARKDAYGEFTVVRRDYQPAHLWTVDAVEAMKAPAKGRQRTRGAGRHVQAFEVSPDGTRVAFGATRTPDLIDGASSDIHVLDLATDAVRAVVSQPGPDTNPRWSPDGTRLAFGSAMGAPKYFHANSRVAIVNVAGGPATSVTDALDEDASLVAWTPTGLYVAALQKTASHLFRVDPQARTVTRVSSPDGLIMQSGSFSADGRTLGLIASSGTTLPEVYVTDIATFSPRALTTRSTRLAGWTLGTREVISWKSQDGETIEGILVKPRDFQPGRKYPLLCVIHGGPTGVDRPQAIDARYYPSDLWVARGALVLKVNYRGSAGYGQRFRQLNVRNLGVGDAWDVLSGIDSLIAKGMVDPNRLGCMGWSQGGYISAFLTTSTTRFRAISVGAGISNWATYYYNTDITPFTIQYLDADPATDPDIYKKTSPMSYVMGAKTPTLIQHGEFDKRVPIANAYELRQGLEDRGVPVEMIVYKGFGHGITKPKSMRAVIQHNLGWFNHHIFGDPPPDLTKAPGKPAAP
ncbi:S9 family peptidase [Luteitalea sp. TBR-22]|uniref:alpha/beta hydrolase family protein n=1 Tax=Luteitalea sp. TBR-22 TaxID=2802971 RepID=UPI001EF6E385|nr:S9 family peptidase [Luteitalea sp. TBR-22]